MTEDQRKQAIEDLQYEIARNGLEYADNFRVARVDDPEEVSAYHEKKRKGCCGSFDTTTIIGGVKFYIGCNYGH